MFVIRNDLTKASLQFSPKDGSVLDFSSLPLDLLLDSGRLQQKDCRRLILKQGTRVGLSGTPRSAHVLLSGVVSHVISFQDGSRIPSRLSTRGDLLELDQLLNTDPDDHDVQVTIPGEAVRIPFSLVEQAFSEDVQFRKAMLASARAHSGRAQRLAACHLFHGVGERLARHLLQLWEESGVDILPLTQEQLASDLGVQRSTIVAAAGELRRKGIISFARGRIRLLDSSRLADEACECYHALSTHKAKDAA